MRRIVDKSLAAFIAGQYASVECSRALAWGFGSRYCQSLRAKASAACSRQQVEIASWLLVPATDVAIIVIRSTPTSSPLSFEMIQVTEEG